jgi:hypothetical protein
MKLLIAICFSAALALAQQESPQPPKPAAKTAKTTKKTEAPDKPPTSIPANAVQIEQGAYRWTDAKGKKWILFETPFGIARKEDTGEPLRHKLQEDHGMQGVKITEDGDSLKFEREGPFGTYKWSKKKTDLDVGEQAAWDRQKSAETAAKSGSK